MNNKEIRSEILKLVEELTRQEQGRYALRDFEDETGFTEELTNVPYAGRVFDAKEVVSSVDCLLDFWLTLGKNGKSFEKKISEFLGINLTK